MNLVCVESVFGVCQRKVSFMGGKGGTDSREKTYHGKYPSLEGPAHKPV